MNIEIINQIPDYAETLNISECAPVVDGQVVKIFDAVGGFYDISAYKRSKYGLNSRPRIKTTVLINESEFLALHVAFVHMWGGGQFYRYYFRPMLGAEINRLFWHQLSAQLQFAVIEAVNLMEAAEAKQAKEEGREYKKWLKSPGAIKPGKIGRVPDIIKQIDPAVIEIEEVSQDSKPGKFDIEVESV
jgi:hypothetical protein